MSYYFAKTLTGGFDEAVRRTTEALKREGFGIITEIDVTLRRSEIAEANGRSGDFEMASRSVGSYQGEVGKPSMEETEVPASIIVKASRIVRFVSQGAELNVRSAPLSPEPFETIRQFRITFSFVRELRDEQRKRLGVTGDP
jgi:hypothetical protein